MPILNLAPGLHENVSERDYHADNLCEMPTLSRSLAQVLLTQAPVHAYHEHPRLGGKSNAADDDSTPGMDFGSLVHRLLLGKGAEIDIGDWPTWQSNASKDFKKSSKEAGKHPVLRKTYDLGVACADGATTELERLGLKAAFLTAKPEVVCVFKDGGVNCRCMFDRLTYSETEATIFDLKITDSAKPEICERQIQNMMYDLQDSFYRFGLARTFPNLEGRIRFIFLFVENSFPFLVTPIELDGAFRTNGTSKYCHALAIWEKCMKLNQWPAYVDGIYKASPKDWALAQEIGRQMPKFKE